MTAADAGSWSGDVLFMVSFVPDLVGCKINLQLGFLPQLQVSLTQPECSHFNRFVAHQRGLFFVAHSTTLTTRRSFLRFAEVMK